MAELKVKVGNYSEAELKSFEEMQKAGTAKVVLGVKENEKSEVEAQGYLVSFTCGPWGHTFYVRVSGPGVYWTVCPYCGHGGWTTVY